MILSCPITKEDIIRAKNIFGSNLGSNESKYSLRLYSKALQVHDFKTSSDFVSKDSDHVHYECSLKSCHASNLGLSNCSNSE